MGIGLRSVVVSAVCIAGLAAAGAQAAETCHYVNGTEGIKAATLPPPGFYWRSYNVYYTAGKTMDGDGNEVAGDFDLNVMATTQRLVWISEHKLFKADYGASIVIPLVNNDLEITPPGAPGPAVDDHHFGFGDIAVEPLALAWHGERWDASFGAAVYLPIGDYDANDPASTGKDHWTGMFTLGGTYYIDAEKTWSASILARYETHSSKSDLDIQAGDDFHFEWGIGKTITPGLDIGVAGYCQWQLTDDEGADVNYDPSIHDRVFAVGPEISGFIPKWGLGLSFRALWEFEAQDRPEGMVATFTLTKSF